MSEEVSPWERVCDDTDRLDVPNGWLYRVRTLDPRGITVSESLAFVPQGHDYFYCQSRRGILAMTPEKPGGPQGVTVRELAGLLSTLDFKPSAEHPDRCFEMAQQILNLLAPPSPAADALARHEDWCAVWFVDDEGKPLPCTCVLMKAESEPPREADFTQSFDARDWARAFIETVKTHPEIPHDEGSMIGWFANAIMRGYDYGRNPLMREVTTLREQLAQAQAERDAAIETARHEKSNHAALVGSVLEAMPGASETRTVLWNVSDLLGIKKRLEARASETAAKLERLREAAQHEVVTFRLIAGATTTGPIQSAASIHGTAAGGADRLEEALAATKPEAPSS